MDVVDAVKMLVAQQGIPPEMVDLAVSKLSDMDALLQAKVENVRAEIIRNKAQAVAALRGTSGTEAICATLLGEIEEMLDTEAKSEDPEEPLVPN